MNYVLGFAFSKKLMHVVMILKTHPAEQAGKFNGIGGAVGEHELPWSAMIREFEEEAGVKTTAAHWQYCGVKNIDDGEVTHKIWIYASRSINIHDCHTCTKEKIFVLQVDNLSTENIVPDVPKMINDAIKQFKNEK